MGTTTSYENETDFCKILAKYPEVRINYLLFSQMTASDMFCQAFSSTEWRNSCTIAFPRPASKKRGDDCNLWRTQLHRVDRDEMDVPFHVSPSATIGFWKMKLIVHRRDEKPALTDALVSLKAAGAQLKLVLTENWQLFRQQPNLAAKLFLLIRINMILHSK